MKTNNHIKRILALTVSASMLGATLLGAGAADLNTYPAPFITDGVFDGVLVVGDDAQADDIVGAIDVATALQYSSTGAGSTGGTQKVVIVGDSYQVKEGENDLLGGEMLSTVVASIDQTELQALSGGSLRNQKGTFNYDENLDLPIAYVAWSVDEEDDTETAGSYLVLPANYPAYTYTLSFTPNLEGEWDATNSEIDEIEDKTLTMFGKDYVIINALAANTDDITLELMGGSTLDTLEEGETKTYTINENDYEVKALIISDTANSGNGEVKFSINGEVTEGLAEGDTYTLNDGTEIGIREILPNEAGETTGGDLVEFYLGANKVTLTDTSVEDSSTWSATVEVGDEDLDNVQAQIYGSVAESAATVADGDTIKINHIKARYIPDDNLYTLAGTSMSAAADKLEDKSGNFLLHGFDILYAGPEGANEENWIIDPRSDDQYVLRFVNKMGHEYNLDLIGCDDGSNECTAVGDLFFGQQRSGTDRYLKLDGVLVADEDTFIVTNDNNHKSRVFRFKDIDTNDEIIELEDIGTDTKLEISYTGPLPASAQHTIDGQSVNFTVTTNSTPYYLNVTGTSSLKMDYIYTMYKGKILFDNSSEPVINVSSSDEYLDETGDVDYIVFNATINSDNEINVDLKDINGGGIQYSEKSMSSEVDNIQIGYTAPYSMRYVYDSEDDQQKFTITHPEQYLSMQVFVTAGLVMPQVVEGEATQTVNRIDVGAAKLASEIASTTAQNVISIGGSCVNKITADLLGLTYPTCGAASMIPENGALLKLVENGEKVALIAAGWTADDTRRATSVLGDYENYILEGAELWITGTTLTDITVSAPSTDAPVEEVPEENTTI